MIKSTCLSYSCVYSLSEQEIYHLLTKFQLCSTLRFHLIYAVSAIYAIKHYKLGHCCTSECRGVFQQKCTEVKNITTSGFEQIFYLYCLHKNAKEIYEYSPARRTYGFPYFIRVGLEDALSRSTERSNQQIFFELYSSSLYKSCQKVFLTEIQPYINALPCSRLVLKRLKFDSFPSTPFLPNLLLHL